MHILRENVKVGFYTFIWASFSSTAWTWLYSCTSPKCYCYWTECPPL